jgi:hypothetical protein
MLARVVKVRRELQHTVVNEMWDEWVERERYRLGDAAEACKTAVMDDGWFKRSEELLTLVQ